MGQSSAVVVLLYSSQLYGFAVQSRWISFLMVSTLGDDLRPELSPFVCGTGHYEIQSKINSGGGGTASAVYSASALETKGSVAIKTSWPSRVYLRWPPETSAQVVLGECRVLHHLAESGVSGIELCLDSCYDPHKDEASIILSPLFAPSQNGNDPDESVAVVANMPATLKNKGAASIAQTAFQMITKGNMVSRDIQLLVNEDNGSVLWIDFTEMVPLSPPTFSKKDLEAIDSFLLDTRRYMQDSESLSVARAAVHAEVRKNDGNVPLAILERLEAAGLY